MSSYRQGTVLGLTVAEAFILFSFLLLIALLGLTQGDEAPPDSDTGNAPRVWVRPAEIETLVNSAKQAEGARKEAEQDRAAAERGRDKALEKAEEARKAEEKAEQARAAAERERDKALEKAEEARKAEEKAEQARAAAERERDKALEKAEEARKARKKAEEAHDQAQSDLELIRRKGENPPCWYEIVSAGERKTRERAHYVFNVAIFENSIKLEPRPAPPGGAFDDGGGLYVDERKWLRIERLPYGKALSNNEFIEAVSDLVAQGRNRQVRTYECVFAVKVWDMTPEHAKKRWKHVHDRIIEESFTAYTVQNDEWKGGD